MGGDKDMGTRGKREEQKSEKGGVNAEKERGARGFSTPRLGFFGFHGNHSL